MKALLVKVVIVVGIVYGAYVLVGGMLLSANPEILRNLQALAQILK